MENSDKVLFDDDTPEWFLAMGDRWVGPLKASDVYERIQKREISFAHFIWKEGQSDWKRISDVKTFQVALPDAPQSKPSKTPAQAKKTPPPPTSHLSQPKEWFLFYNNTQFGPFSEEEIERYIQLGKLHAKVHAWKEGMKGWEMLEKIKLYAPILKEFGSAKPKSKKSLLDTDNQDVKLEQRKDLRAPLVAKVVMSNDGKGTKGAIVSIGVCRDISIGGMQVLTDKIPGKVGSKVKLNVSPSDFNQKGPINAFVAEGVIVRVLEDGRGFSFRFEKISDQAKETIETYLESV